MAIELWLLERTAERVVLGVRRDLAGRLLRLRLSALDREALGDSVARATSDSTLLGSVASTAFVQLLAGRVTLLGAIVLVGVVDLVLLAVTFSVLVVVGSAVAVVLPRIMRATERQQEAVGSLGAALEAHPWRLADSQGKRRGGARDRRHLPRRRAGVPARHGERRLPSGGRHRHRPDDPGGVPRRAGGGRCPRRLGGTLPWPT